MSGREGSEWETEKMAKGSSEREKMGEPGKGRSLGDGQEG